MTAKARALKAVSRYASLGPKATLLAVHLVALQWMWNDAA